MPKSGLGQDVRLNVPLVVEINQTRTKQSVHLVRYSYFVVEIELLFWSTQTFIDEVGETETTTVGNPPVHNGPLVRLLVV